MGLSGGSTIWKFPVSVADQFTVEMPAGARVLHVAVQDGKPYMWALVDPDQPTRLRMFHIRGTGHPVDPDLVYIGSWMELRGRLVWHLFGASNPGRADA